METGNYVLLLQLLRPESIAIGRLGTFAFNDGWYTYVGSAFGAGGLVGRLKHHLRPVQRPHWHIDYLRQAAELKEVWLAPSFEPREAEWVEAVLGIPGAEIGIDGFGASDSDKESHLAYFPVRPALDDFSVVLRQRFPDTKVMRAYQQD